jgi:hypothetical protein
LVGIENLVWLQVEGFDKVYAIANEDLERSTEEKTSAVHFMRFELSGEMIAGLREDTGLTFGTDHAGYPYRAEVDPETRASLIADLEDSD